MQNLLNPKPNDEIDLREIFIVLWAYKLFIATTCALCILLSGYYALNKKKIYTSSAIFKLSRDNNISIPGQLSSLSSLIGVGNNIDTSSTLDRIKGRVFIEEIDTKLNFKLDPYFNTYDPNPVDPIWKDLIKRAIGWQKSSIDLQEAVWQNIVATYSKNIGLNKTKDGSLEIIVTHEKPKRAAEIANVIMDEIIINKKIQINDSANEHLSYLSSTLAKALSELEISQSKLKEFTQKNSALPLESFAVVTLQLDAFREQLNRTVELYDAVAELSLMLKKNATSQDDYHALRQTFPIVDQVEFRRIFGQNEIINSWSWPEASSVDAVFDTLLDRKNRLQSQISVAQSNAARSSLTLDTYAKLQRNAKVAEATYTVLIEQVKAQSMIAGYKPDNSIIFEYASPSINPSAPNRNLILALGAALGLCLGSTLSLILSSFRGVYYSKNSLKIGSQARLSASMRSLLPLRDKSLNNVISFLKKKQCSVLIDIAVGINKSTASQVVVTSTRAKLASVDVARAIACYMQSDSVNIAIIDFSTRVKKKKIDGEILFDNSFIVSENVDNISILRLENNLSGIEFLSRRNFWKNIKSLNSKYDLVFLSADNNNAISLLNALEGQRLFHITLARTKKTKSSTLLLIRSLLPIQGLLHD